MRREETRNLPRVATTAGPVRLPDRPGTRRATRAARAARALQGRHDDALLWLAAAACVIALGILWLARPGPDPVIGTVVGVGTRTGDVHWSGTLGDEPCAGSECVSSLGIGEPWAWSDPASVRIRVQPSDGGPEWTVIETEAWDSVTGTWALDAALRCQPGDRYRLFTGCDRDST